jgi:hypothetical protein
MTKFDLKKVHKHLYAATNECTTLEVPELVYLMIDGAGDPNTARVYRDAVTALYTVAYRAKFITKAATGVVDHTVMPLEGLWWTDDMADFSMVEKAKWKWTMLIAQPDHMGEEHVAEAIEYALAKKKLDAAASVRLRRWKEGRAAQLLHIGPYADEAPTIEKLHSFIAASGLTLRGHHHEIYLSDPTRVAPEKLKTIIRQPVA